jgi:2-dehydro-3-deoxygalactonokinase
LEWDGPFIAVDWGTTNRRAWRIAADGAVEEACADAGGITAVRAGGFAAEAAGLRARLGDLPMLLGGMIGSDRGWRNVPYVPCPADSRALAAGIAWIDARTGIVPGICQPDPRAPEVMRGEEVQIVGAIASGLMPEDALVCCPGTHAKWAQTEAGRIARFATWMTGEVFALVTRHSILAPQLQGEAQPGDGFAAGVAASADGDALGHLFALRAGAVLGHPFAEGVSYASGLLIGAEVRAALARFGSAAAPYLIGRTDLTALYAAAIGEVRGEALSSHHRIDGETAFRAGLRAIIRNLP